MPTDKIERPQREAHHHTSFKDPLFGEVRPDDTGLIEEREGEIDRLRRRFRYGFVVPTDDTPSPRRLAVRDLRTAFLNLFTGRLSPERLDIYDLDVALEDVWCALELKQTDMASLKKDYDNALASAKENYDEALTEYRKTIADIRELVDPAMKSEPASPNNYEEALPYYAIVLKVFMLVGFPNPYDDDNDA
jgi:hypothetical protein